MPQGLLQSLSTLLILCCSTPHTPYIQRKINKVASPILTEQAWHQERLTTYLNISRQVQTLHALLIKAQDAVEAIKGHKKTEAHVDVLTTLLLYNMNHKQNAIKPDLDSITNVDDAAKALEESKKEANKVHEMLWGQKSFAGSEELKEVKELQEARKLKQIVDMDVDVAGG